jgi:NAD(P)-dependent dehydrogenase (short-subunit alcohol dehydrogenase family)
VDTPSPEFARTLAVNLSSQFYVAKYVTPMMLEAGSGAIVNTTSTQALQCQERVLAYAASKGAVLSMTKSMALDLAPRGIRVNAIAPGSIDTPMLREAAQRFSPEDPAGQVARWGRAHPLGRVGTPAEVAKLVAFLLLDATFMTGAIVTIDGGLTARLM